MNESSMGSNFIWLDGWWIIEWMIMMLRMKSKTGCRGRGGLRDGLYENGNNYD